MPSEKEQRTFEELIAWTLGLRDAGFIHQHVVDAWAAQHATEKSTPISVAFALIGLYLHLEQGFTGREVQRAHMRLAQPYGRGPGRKEWPRFKFPKERGRITAIDVVSAPEKERPRTIDRWCQSVFEAWKDSHAAVIECVNRDMLRRASW
jgi:hypothetical protein